MLKKSFYLGFFLLASANAVMAALPLDFTTLPSISNMTSGETQRFTYTIRNNVPNKALPIYSINVVADNSAQSASIYSVGHTCGSALAPFSSCSITVTIKGPQKGNIFSHLSINYGGRAPLVSPINLSVQANYTVLVYMVGSDLESAGQFATKNIQQMEQIGSTGNLNVILETGGARAPGWLTVQRKEVLQNSTLLLDDLGPINMSAPSTIQDFLTWGVTNYPAKKYIVVFWDHGGGPNGGFGGDEVYTYPPEATPLNQLVSAVLGASNATGKKMEIIGFDACLMQTAEIAAGLYPYANYIVASEDLEPGNGWQYNTFLQYLVNNPNAGGLPVGIQIVNGYTAANAGSSTTLSVIDSSEMPAVTEAAGNFGTALNNYLTSVPNWENIARGRLDSPDYSTSVWDRLYTDTVDLYELATLIPTFVSDPDVGTAATALINATTAAVKYFENSDNRQASHGLAIYFPSILPAYDTNYPSNLMLNGTTFFSTAYVNFITAYHTFYSNNKNALVAVPSDPTFSGGNYEATVSNNYDDLFAVVGNDACTNLYLNDFQHPLAAAPCYTSVQYDGIVSSAGAGNTWDISFNKATHANSWPLLNGKPMLLIPSDTQPAIPSDVTYIIPVTKLYANGALTPGYLIATLDGSVYSVIGFQRNVGSVNTEGKVESIEDDEQFYIRSYATLNGGTIWSLILTDTIVTAPFSITFGSVPTSGAPPIYNAFRFLVGDLTGALNVSNASATY